MKSAFYLIFFLLIFSCHKIYQSENAQPKKEKLLLKNKEKLSDQKPICHTNIVDESISTKNSIDEFLEFDFSKLWLETDEYFIFGIIGENHQRIQVKFISVEKNPKNPKEYLVKGKTKVKNNICDFQGKIVIDSIQLLVDENFGVDDEFKNSGIKKESLLTANYQFYEDKNQKHSGIFSGRAQSLFYINKDNELKYNDINNISDSYFNNSFVGKWKSYFSSEQEICNWADYRVPNCNCDFDIGAGFFSVSDEYKKFGWEDFNSDYDNFENYNQWKNQKKWWNK